MPITANCFIYCRLILLFSLFSLLAPSMAATAEVAILGTENSITAVKRQPTGRGPESEPAEPAAVRQEMAAAVPQALAGISAKSAIIINDSDGTVLFARDADQPRQPASTIKILTGLIALRALAGDEPVPVSREAASRPSSKMYLDPARTYRADELISGVLLGSANDASVALAELISGSEAAFTEIMNLQASHFGATRTVCKTATGLTADNQASTARDLALIFREAMRDERFAGRMQIRSFTTDDGNTIYNHNKALWRIDGAQGGKTGYTLAARQTYVGKFNNGNTSLIVAIMGSETMWRDLKQLVSFGFDRQTAQAPAQRQPGPDLLANRDSRAKAQSFHN